ncbi:hypothetical protein AU512_13005 [Lonsdalea iberica]|uniref:YD repeat-containing protein n=1 Tax=Lonsdalea iberica TaxID=1082703 RepID=A0ABX3XDK7_9GAMM|nr:RHS repeat domain-containing protein [Lonsdalea iberica]OSN08936.1 hypothetical protein AU512_13005 [Lonsdalea iberica]
MDRGEASSPPRPTNFRPDDSRWQGWLDAAGRVIREQDMAGTVTHYGYDEDGYSIEVSNVEDELLTFQ